MTIRRVLLVDDEPDMRELVGLVLGHMAGWTVIAAESGIEALRVGAAAAPDLVLLDVMMPGLDGPATLTRLRAEPWAATVPIVFMTAEVNDAAVARYRALGAIGVIKKPFDPMTLVDEVRAVYASGSEA